MNIIVKSNDKAMIREISEVLAKNGMQAGDILISTIINQYINLKKEVLINGDYVDEVGLGVVKPTFRKVSKKFSEKQFTSRISVEVDKEFKEELNNKLISDLEYARKVNGEEIYEANYMSSKGGK